MARAAAGESPRGLEGGAEAPTVVGGLVGARDTQDAHEQVPDNEEGPTAPELVEEVHKGSGQGPPLARAPLRLLRRLGRSSGLGGRPVVLRPCPADPFARRTVPHTR